LASPTRFAVFRPMGQPARFARVTASLRILIVDDHASVREGIRAFLETKTDFAICAEAADGESAIQQAKLFKPDLIILDLALPLLNGVEAASILRGELPNIKIVAFTMYANELGRAIRSATRIDAVLPKSSSLTTLVETIRRLMDSPPSNNPSQPVNPNVPVN
jgi:DNA-binding NarL/FixJ family response regulator